MSTDSPSGTVLAGGAEVPALGLGTARTTGEECRRAVEAALAAGYRHVDTAQVYDNEAAVGEAVANASVPREEVFLVTKADSDHLERDAVIERARDSFDRLRTTSVDLFLIHAPSDEVPVSETLEAMNELQAEGAVDHVGVSNFSVGQLEEAIEVSETPIVTNQVKYNPYHRPGADRAGGRDDDLLAACIENDVLLTAYSPLARGDVVGDDRLAEIGRRHDKSAAQVTLRWLLQQPYVAAIPKAASREHVEANADIFDFELSPAEMREIFEIGDGVPEALEGRLG